MSRSPTRPPFRLTLVFWLTGIATALFVAFAYVGISGQEIREALITEREDGARAVVARIESRLEAELFGPLRQRGEEADLDKAEQRALARAIINDGLERSGFERYYRLDQRGAITIALDDSQRGRSIFPHLDFFRALRGQPITTRLSQGSGAPEPQLLAEGETLESFFRRKRHRRGGRRGSRGGPPRSGPPAVGPPRTNPSDEFLGRRSRPPREPRGEARPPAAPASATPSGSGEGPKPDAGPGEGPRPWPRRDGRRDEGEGRRDDGRRRGRRRPRFPPSPEEHVDFEDLRGLVIWMPVEPAPASGPEPTQVETIIYLSQSAESLRSTATLRGLAQASFSTLGVLALMVALSLSIRKANRTMVTQAEEVMKANRELAELSESLERQVDERSQQLLQAKTLASIGRLSAGVAHEVCNPTASIASCAEGLLRDLRRPEAFKDEEGRAELREYLEIIRDEAFRIKGITRNLLDFSRGTNEPQSETVALTEVLDATLRLLGHRLDSENKSLELDLEPVDVQGSSSGLRQLVLNLTVNAIDAIGDGGHIRWSLRPTEDGARLVCEDDGPGFSPEDLEAALEPFHTTKPVGQGTGLGLAIAYSIAKQHGGHIRLANRPSGGARVTVTLAPAKVRPA